MKQKYLLKWPALCLLIFISLGFKGLKMGRNDTQIKVCKMGSQTWMAENLQVEKFRNGDPIPEAKTFAEFENAFKQQKPCWCYYDLDVQKGKSYGKLYNWYAVNDARGLAPEGWKIPSDTDWINLANHLGGMDKAGKKLKSAQLWENHQGKTGNGSNEGGFNAFPGGYRYDEVNFGNLGKAGYWWCSNEYNKFFAWYIQLGNDIDYVYKFYKHKKEGMSVRCLKK